MKLTHRIPFLVTVLGMALGVAIAIVFGISESYFKDHISEGLKKNVKINAIQDSVERDSKIKYEAGKNWRYFQRYHFHATGIAAMTLAVLMFLSFLNGPQKEILVTKYILAMGGFLYPFVWLFAGYFGPEMGRHEAKEAFAFLGYAGGLSLFGLLQALWLGLRYPFQTQSKKS